VFSRLYSSEFVEEFQNPIWAEWFDGLTILSELVLSEIEGVEGQARERLRLIKLIKQ